MPASDGLLYLKELLLGADELQWLQVSNDERQRKVRRAMMLTDGLVVARRTDGSLETNWLVHDDDDDGTITVAVAAEQSDLPEYAVLVDDEGYVAYYDRDHEDITLPNNDTWYTITAETVATQYEEGTLSLTAGSAVINGTNTHFLLFSGKTSSGFGRGTKIRIDAADSAAGNAGTYEIDQVVSDTQIILTAAIPGGNETVARFTVAGNFLTTIPADPDIHQRRVIRIQRNAGGILREPPSGVYPLADVKRNDAGSPRVKFIDRREQRMYRSAVPWGLRTSQVTTVMPQSNHDLTGGAPFTALLDYGFGRLATTNAVANAVCPCIGSGSPNRTLLLTEDGGTIYAARNDDPFGAMSMLYIPTGGTFVGAQPALARLPPASGFTHVCCYIDGGILQARQTQNDGTAWGGAVTVLDPTANDPADTCSWPSVIRLLNGRLLVAVEYFDNSAGRSYVVGAISDDHGATWDTNGGTGYVIKTVPGPVPPAADIGRPSLGQSADGKIWCAYTVNGNDIGLTSSDDRTGTWTGLLSPTSDIVVEDNGYFDTVNSPALWVSPDGQPIIFFQGYRLATTHSYVCYAAIGYQRETAYVLHQRLLFDNDTALGAAQDLGLAVCQDNGGTLTFAWVYTPSATDDTYVSRLVPVSMPFQSGGNNRYRES